MTHDFFDVDDSYDGVLDQNATHIRTAGLAHLRDVGRTMPSWSSCPKAVASS